MSGGPELVFAVSAPAFRKEVRAWIRRSRWWAHPLVAGVALALSPVVFLVGMAAERLGVSFFAVSFFWAMFGVLPLLLAVRPYGLARAMSARLDPDRESHLRVHLGQVVLTTTRELRVPLSHITAIRERPDFIWLCLTRRRVIFVPRRPRLGDVRAFMDILHAQRQEPAPARAPDDDAVEARAAFAQPSRVVHIARTYAVALRSPMFLLLVVFAALSLVGAVAAMPWHVSQTLVLPLLALSASLVVLLTTPALRIALGSRHRLGEPGSVTVWSAHADVLRSDGPSGAVDIPWSDVRGLKRIGRFGVLELSSGRLILGATDAVTGDPFALFATIESHARKSSRA